MFNDICTIPPLHADIKPKLGMKERIFKILNGSVYPVSSTGKKKEHTRTRNFNIILDILTSLKKVL